VPSFAVLPSNFKRPYLFNRSADLGEFYVQSKGFPCSTWKSSDFGRMDEKKRGPFFLMWGFFRVKNTKVALLVTYGTGLLTRTEIRLPCCPQFVHAICGSMKRRFISTPSIAPAKLAVCAVFRCFALQLQKAISFNRSADLGEFYVKSKGFPCSTWKSSDFGRMDEKEGAFLPHVGLFQG